MKIKEITLDKIKNKQAVLIVFSSRENLFKYYNSDQLISDKEEYQVLVEETEEKEHVIK